MAHFLLHGHGSFLLLLITLAFVGFCSSSSFPIYDVDSSANDFDDDLPVRYMINIPDSAIYPSKDLLRKLRLKSMAIPSTSRHHESNNKRYASQAFHAMRG